MTDLDPWAFIDAVFCITLDTTTHRHPRLQAELERVKLWPKTTLLINQRDPQGGVRGCFESHRKAWSNARERGFKRVLIVEDDVFFTQDWAKNLNDVSRFLDENEDWDCFFLGWAPFKSQRTPWKHVERMVCGTAMHAYIVSHRAMAKGLPSYDTVLKPVDDYLMCNQCTKAQRATPLHSCMSRGTRAPYNNYVLKPMIAFQVFDATSSTMAARAVRKRLANVRLLRLVGSGTSTMSMPMLVVTCVLASLALVSIVVCIVVVCIKLRGAATQT